MHGNKQLKLTNGQRNMILIYHREGRTIKQLAQMYGMSTRQIGRIVRHETRYKGPRKPT